MGQKALQPAAAPVQAVTTVARWKSLGDRFGSPLRAVCGSCGISSLGLLQAIPMSDLGQLIDGLAEFISSTEQALAVVRGPRCQHWRESERLQLIADLENDIAEARQRLDRQRSALSRGGSLLGVKPESWAALWHLSPELQSKKVIYAGYADSGYLITSARRRNPAGEVAGARPHIVPWVEVLTPAQRRAYLALHERWKPQGQRPTLPCRIVCPRSTCETLNLVEWPTVLYAEAEQMWRLHEQGLSGEQALESYRR